MASAAGRKITSYFARTDAQNNREVFCMTDRDFWELFAETGEPLCWLVCRALSTDEAGADGEETAGD